MDRAFELFERLQAGGLSALEKLLIEEEPESLFLDYKRAATRENDSSLNRNDRENLSKALSVQRRWAAWQRNWAKGGFGATKYGKQMFR